MTALLDAVAPLPAVGLAELDAHAALMTRVDNKHLLPVALVGELVQRLDARVRDAGRTLQVLEIDGLRSLQYDSVYFDTEDFALFRHHLQGRRRRYKVRSRTYVDSGLCMFEVKLKGARGETVKVRTSRLPEQREQPDEEFLTQSLAQGYGTAPLPVEARITTQYRRTTLVDLEAGERVTLDVGLVCSDGERTVPADSHVVVETKSADGRGAADLVLRELGVRPVRLSKYCTAVALLHPHLPASRWARTLREHYGWERAA